MYMVGKFNSIFFGAKHAHIIMSEVIIIRKFVTFRWLSNVG